MACEPSSPPLPATTGVSEQPGPTPEPQNLTSHFHLTVRECSQQWERTPSGTVHLWGVRLCVKSLRKRALRRKSLPQVTQWGIWNLGQGLDFSHCSWPDVQGRPRAHRLAAVPCPRPGSRGRGTPSQSWCSGGSVLPSHTRFPASCTRLLGCSRELSCLRRPEEGGMVPAGCLCAPWGPAGSLSFCYSLLDRSWLHRWGSCPVQDPRCTSPWSVVIGHLAWRGRDRSLREERLYCKHAVQLSVNTGPASLCRQEPGWGRGPE